MAFCYWHLIKRRIVLFILETYYAWCDPIAFQGYWWRIFLFLLFWGLISELGTLEIASIHYFNGITKNRIFLLLTGHWKPSLRSDAQARKVIFLWCTLMCDSQWIWTDLKLTCAQTFLIWTLWFVLCKDYRSRSALSTPFLGFSLFPFFFCLVEWQSLCLTA